MIDRLPHGRQWAVMRQKWRDLLFIHWPINPEALRPLIPSPLELDLFEGTAYVGLVPFTMTGVRPVGLPAVAGLSSFHETNVRTYVRLADRDPGVWFFNLEAANSIAVRLARRLFHLPYHYARMFLEHESDATAPSSQRRSSTPAHAAGLVRCQRRTPSGPSPSARSNRPRPAPSNTSWSNAISSSPHGKVELYQGRVHHTPYPLQSAKLLSLDETLLAAAGIERPEIAPLAHFAAGVNVEVFPLRL